MCHDLKQYHSLEYAEIKTILIRFSIKIFNFKEENDWKSVNNLKTLKCLSCFDHKEIF